MIGSFDSAVSRGLERPRRNAPSAKMSQAALIRIYFFMVLWEPNGRIYMRVQDGESAGIFRNERN